MLLVLLLVVAIAAAALAINWAYLVTVFRHMQQTTDTLSLAAAPQVLDDALLCDMNCDNVDESLVTKEVVAAYLSLTNQEVSARLQMSESDLLCTLGRIENPHLRLDDFVFEETTPYNALRVEAFRTASGDNPVAHLIGGFVGVDPADVRAVSYAVLDSQVIGFCPRPGILSPVVPLAIDATAYAARTADADGDDIREFTLQLNSSDSDVAADATGALIDLGDVAIDIATILTQIEAGGVSASDLAGGKLGPLGSGPTMDYPDNPGPLGLPAQQQSPNETDTEALVATLTTIAGSDNPKRVFPVYSSIGSGEAQLTGFVAARIVSAVDEAEGGDTEHQRLSITIEPCYLIHTTTWTSAVAAARNLYVYQLRLVR